MKTTTWLMFTGMVAAVAATVVSNAQAGGTAKRQGTSVLHYMTQNTLVATESGSNVTGSVRLEYHEQGGSSKQSLRLKVSGLETNAAYTLIAMVGDDTNAMPVDSFATYSAGKACLYYQTRSQGRGGKKALPDQLNPLTDVQSIGLENSTTQTVAYAWIADADKFQYLVKRNLAPEDTNGTASGSISLIANANKVCFRLRASGLDATNDYQLALNSDIVSTVTANTNGQVVITAWPSNALPVLELSSLALLDASSNVVLSTTLPLESLPSTGTNSCRRFPGFGHGNWHGFTGWFYSHGREHGRERGHGNRRD